MTQITLEEVELAILFHNTYERLAPSFGYETRLDTKYFETNTPNGMLMIAVCKEIIKWQEQRMYSEEEVRKMLSESFNATIEGYNITADEIIEQSKKQKSLDLDKLESKLDNALNIETTEYLTEWIGNKRNNYFDIEKLAESIYGKGVKEDYEEGFVDGYNKAKENYEVTSSVRELHQYKLGLNDGYNKAIKNTYTKEQTIEISDDEIEKAALDWCLGLDEKGCNNTGDDYDNHELPAFIAACKWYRKKLNEIIESFKLK